MQMPEFFKRPVVIFVGVCLALLAICLLWWVLFGGSSDRKDIQLQSNVDQQKGVNSVLVNEAKKAENDVQNKAENTNKAVNALRDSINKPSNQFDGNSAGSRFCADFPDDPSCPK